MKKVNAIFVLAIVLVLGGCMAAKQAPPASGASASSQTVSASKINWAKVSQYYHDYVAGLIAPVGLTVAAVADPSAGPAIALASKEVANLDSLLAAKASNADIQAQAKIVGQAVTDANAKVGAVLASASALPGSSGNVASGPPATGTK
jgi:hypothetical protein